MSKIALDVTAKNKVDASTTSVTPSLLTAATASVSAAPAAATTSKKESEELTIPTFSTNAPQALMMFNATAAAATTTAAAATTTKKASEESTSSQNQIKFYDEYNREIQAGNKSVAEFYVWCVNRALAYSNDRTCAMSFLSDMGKHQGTKNLVNGFATMIILSLQGDELRKYLAGFTVPGIARFEFAGQSSNTPHFWFPPRS